LFVVVAVVIALACSACSSGSSNAAPSTAAPSSTVPSARCAAYRALSALDLRITNESYTLARDWPRFRADLAAAYLILRGLYHDVAKNASGSLRLDAQTVSDFMPTSHAVVLASPSFAEYRATVSRARGDAAVRAAGAPIDADASASCAVQLTHARIPTTTPA
jgi:hypothetical protein